MTLQILNFTIIFTCVLSIITFIVMLITFIRDNFTSYITSNDVEIKTKSNLDHSVECSKCGVYLNDEKAKKVKNIFNTYYNYCDNCKPPYDEIDADIYKSELRYYKTERFEVNNNGKRLK